MLRILMFISLMAFCKAQNLIKGGKATQSSTHSGDNVLYSADRAIDGDLEKCADTDKMENSWWNVDLLGLYEISNITIYNVNQSNIDLRAGQIFIGNSSKTKGEANSKCANITNSTRNTNTTFNCSNGPMVGRYVTVYLERSGFLILCEVWIYGTKVTPFILINESKTWEDALNYCRDHNMDLASITDKDTQTWVELEAMKADSQFVWLGLRYTCTLEFWFWVDDHPLGHKNWAQDEPKGGCDMSAAINTTDHRWSSKSDNEKFNFICAT